MQGKLRQLMKHEGINSTRLAEMLGIQASGISHIMSGRNKPSFDFLLKLLQRFPQINPDWLLLDKGPMYRDEIKKKPGAGNSTGAQGAVGAANIDGSGSFGGGGSVGMGAGGAGSAGSAGRTGGAGSPGDMGVLGDTEASGELFGPDNNDIISARRGLGEHPGGFPGEHPGNFPGQQPGSFTGQHPGGHHAEHHGTQTDRQAVLPNTPPNAPSNEPMSQYQKVQQKLQLLQQAQQQSQQQSQQQAGQPIQQQNPQPAVYQSGGFTKSALIERIVVFYKDKTFSEYQPE